MKQFVSSLSLERNTRSAVADGNLVPGNGDLAPDALRLYAKEKCTCPSCSPVPCKFSRSAGWELHLGSPRTAKCSLMWILSG